jgi:hypothetical protein
MGEETHGDHGMGADVFPPKKAFAADKISVGAYVAG